MLLLRLFAVWILPRVVSAATYQYQQCHHSDNGFQCDRARMPKVVSDGFLILFRNSAIFSHAPSGGLGLNDGPSTMAPGPSSSPKLPFVSKFRDKFFKRSVAVVVVHTQTRPTPRIPAQSADKEIDFVQEPAPAFEFLPRLSFNRDSVCSPGQLHWTYAGGFFRTVACWTSRPWLIALCDDVLLIVLLYYWILRP